VVTSFNFTSVTTGGCDNSIQNVYPLLTRNHPEPQSDHVHLYFF
jgi:hypothetical protein